MGCIKICSALGKAIAGLEKPTKLTTTDRFKLTTVGRLKLTTRDRVKLTTF